ncbi:MAG: LOG family protein [Acidobacteriota bacterium]
MNERQLRRVKRLMSSNLFRKAYEDLEFLHREELRPVRLQLELMKPELQMREQGVASTIVVFGSTRIHPKHEAERLLAAARRALAKKPGSAALARRVRSAAKLLEKSRFYDEARDFARRVSIACQKGGEKRFVISTGGGPGIMEAANRGAYEAGKKTIGLGISLPLEQYPNPYITPELNFHFHYFAIRKMHFLLRAKAIVAFPGGFGTFDELFEVLTLVQTLKVPRMPIILFGRTFWDRVVDFDVLVEEGVIDPPHARLMTFVETAEEAWQVIRTFYKMP